MSDEPIKLAPPDAPLLDDIILGDDEQTAPTPPVYTRSAVPPAVTEADLGSTDERPSARAARPASDRVRSAEPMRDARKRSKMTLRIPDDEVSRPQLPATTPGVGVAAVSTGRRPSSSPSSPDLGDDGPLAMPRRGQRIGSTASGGDPDDTLELPPKDGGSTPPRRAAGIDASHEPGWTPYQPPVSERSESDRAERASARAAARTAEAAAAAARAGAMREPAKTVFDDPDMALGHDGVVAGARRSESVPPPSEEIPVDTDDDDEPPPRDVSGELATSPWLPAALDSEAEEAEEIKLEDGERVTDPGAEVEVEPEDLVSVESIPTPGSLHAPPPLKGGVKPSSTPSPPLTATALMTGVTGAGASAAAAPLAAIASFTTGPGIPIAAGAAGPIVGPPAARSPSAPAPAAAPAAPTGQSSYGAQGSHDGGVARPSESDVREVQPVAGTPMARRPQPAGGPFGFMQGGLGALAPPAMNESAAHRKKTRPWWEDLFNDDFIRTMAKITDGDIAREANFIEESLGCEAGATILDLACGTGRHAVELAARGYQVVGFDLSLAMLARASDEAQDRNQKINFVQGDMREMTFEETFDGVYSWNTSFGFFDEEKNAAVIAKVHRALKKGGQFLLDVVNRDCIVRSAPSLAWFEGDGCICMDEMQIDFITSRMKVKRTLMMDDGRTKEIEYSIRVYSLHELGKMLHDNGFRVAEVSGRTGTPGAFFGCESPRTLILAEKR